MDAINISILWPVKPLFLSTVMRTRMGWQLMMRLKRDWREKGLNWRYFKSWVFFFFICLLYSVFIHITRWCFGFGYICYIFLLVLRYFCYMSCFNCIVFIALDSIWLYLCTFACTYVSASSRELWGRSVGAVKKKESIELHQSKLSEKKIFGALGVWLGKHHGGHLTEFGTHWYTV